ncbi:ATP-dependent helicase [Roseovarius sp. SCSIO 43702]|uniref:ATP-dependent helicase n=1 Tax=Roseovarius sp. SCSIO 43702 TaxID=2823043 RepID=UPI001C7383E5|nr:ATP-dependent helicase [Roseovarius sp. SCSIO 43702]QYX55957.1 ATP-dependent helicase [Roseovarius sp. SCSIO 43702]
MNEQKPPEASHLITEWDADQLRVITESSGARLVVEAGPGTGKTAVACARLAHLIANEDIEPSNILMISFTRAAAAEIRKRLYSYVGEASYAVRNATIDSHAWTIRSGHDPNARVTQSYDDNIDRVISLMKTDEDVAEEQSRLEYVVIDEAQDIEGRRAELIATMIKLLPPDCGVTVFADEAQAIYGFSKRKSRRNNLETDSSLLVRVRAGVCGHFSVLSLSEVHRTSTPQLKTIYSELRTELMKPEHQVMELREWVAGAIENLSAGDIESFLKQYPKDAPQDLLVLFRNRADVLEFSQGQMDAHRLRLTGYEPGLPAWLALCFSDFREPFVSRERFSELWRGNIGEESSAREGWLLAWDALLKLAGRRGDVVDILQLRRRLAGRRPPIEIAETEFGLEGFTLSTIHASKGREADVVILMMPTARKLRSVEDVVEEARVLFVGATRARKELYVVPREHSWAQKLYSGRNFHSSQNFSEQRVSIEVGRNGDIEVSGLVGMQGFQRAEASAAQKYLAASAQSVMVFRLSRRQGVGFKYGIDTDDTARCVGMMSDNFSRDVRELSCTTSSKAYNAPELIESVRAQGCSSIVLSPEDETVASLHEPWASTGFILKPRLAAFPTYKTQRK